ncbi:putative CHY-type Zn-finger protein [Scopulibacillus daqui]|uniref:CHY-type Zn-finger protein n=1 Tax=Scopulibacillus daqui TaxID=1469162 RepID=A0ABS2Q1F7_9BACL|nr:CHY zinc finger protein [Scopulibacillus daqui]MBM7646128.1 putative CHY-type Zn-finger protein [Scopulibacillus daqui]
MEIKGHKVLGVDTDEETRCKHYHTEKDIIAIKFKCCRTYFPCYECHEALADHPAEVWTRSEQETKAVLCGACRYELTIKEYLECDSNCPKCRAEFNPGCQRHYHLYFE